MNKAISATEGGESLVTLNPANHLRSVATSEVSVVGGLSRVRIQGGAALDVHGGWQLRYMFVAEFGGAPSGAPAPLLCGASTRRISCKSDLSSEMRS